MGQSLGRVMQKVTQKLDEEKQYASPPAKVATGRTQTESNKTTLMTGEHLRSQKKTKAADQLRPSEGAGSSFVFLS